MSKVNKSWIITILVFIAIYAARNFYAPTTTILSILVRSILTLFTAYFLVNTIGFNLKKEKSKRARWVIFIFCLLAEIALGVIWDFNLNNSMYLELAVTMVIIFAQLTLKMFIWLRPDDDFHGITLILGFLSFYFFRISACFLNFIPAAIAYIVLAIIAAIACYKTNPDGNCKM